MKHLILICGLLGLLLFSCGTEDLPGGRELPQAYSSMPGTAAYLLETRELSRVSEGCQSDSTNCAVFKAAFPLIKSSAPTAQRINDSIRAEARRATAVFSAVPEEVPASLEATADQFLQEFALARREDPGIEAQWIVELKGEVLHQSDSTLSIKLKTYAFAGGAHPNTFVNLMVFDKQSGEKLQLEGLIKNLGQLREVAERAFRKERELPSEESLDDAGFFWGEGFQLPENYALTQEGLLLHYNPYEAAPYVLGPTAFTIPYNQITNDE